MKSIQTKFILLILGCVLLSSTVIGGAGIINAKSVVDEDSERIMNLMCNERAQEIDALLLRIEQSVDTLASYTSNHLDDFERFKTDTAYVNAYTDYIEDIAVNAALNTEGALAVYVRYNPAFTEPTSGLFWSRTKPGGALQRLTPTDLSLYSSEDVEHVGWYYQPVENGEPLWMMPYENKNLGVMMVSYVVPIYRDGVAIGVVGMDIDFRVIEHIVKEVSIYDTGYAFLSDSEGRILSHRTIDPGTSMSDVVESLHPNTEELRKSIAQHSLVSYMWHGEEKRMVLSGLHNGMRLGLTAPASEIDKGMNSLIVQSLVLFAVIAVLSVVLTVLVVRRIVRPLRELNSAAKQIADGDLSVALTSQTKDEVGTLSRSLQQMADHLRSYIAYINDLAYLDGLTGLKNKTAYKDAVSRLDEAIQTGKPEFAVVVLDINGLKEVNDTLGHDFGDMLIIDSCKIICDVFSHSPVYRIGGDEFAVILQNSDLAHYADLLTHLEEELDTRRVSGYSENTVPLARGIARYEAGVDRSFADVFKRADEAMYRNKARIKGKQAEYPTGDARDEGSAVQ
ncbi:diguanylate cyclase [Eggerthella sp. YY7918]|uniref:sensor domain-containing diguanylate cyclase n=1 Tax=Eggerthella sp. (strain YY7918) TaxID=502558 RepID=UPI000217123A|nr:diguanylate cyclase [Eggerthella sp. YY7918]BAK44163.1 hypothetical protein EGYY_09760 [Eggerthella sp. YY7918]